MSMSKNSKIENKQELFNELPLALKILITTDISKNVMETIPFFSHKDNVFNATILPMLQPVHLGKKESIYKIYDVAQIIYFIEEGTVNFLTKHNLSYKLIKKGFYFGDIELLMKIPRISSSVCYSNCKFLSMSKEVLFNLIVDEFPDVYDELENDAPLKYNKDIEVIKARENIYKKNLISRFKNDNDKDNSKSDIIGGLRFNKKKVEDNLVSRNIIFNLIFIRKIIILFLI